MNVPPWFVDLVARPLPVEPPDPAPRPLGTAVAAEPIAAGIRLLTEQAAVEVGLLADAVAEVRVVGPEDVALPSFARPEWPFGQAPQLRREESESGWRLRGAALQLEIGRDPLRLRIAGAGGESLWSDDPGLGVCATRNGWRAHVGLGPEDRCYGLGAKTGALDRRGRRTMLWTRDMFIGENSDPLYSAIPFVLIRRGARWIGVLSDSAARQVFDLGAQAADRLSFGPDVGPLVYVLFAGPTLRDVLSQYTSLTGRMPLPPLWALGHHQSRYSYADEEEVRDVAAEFRRRDIPTDAIHLDIHYMRGFRVFTFNSSRFPDPAGLARDLAPAGFRLVAIVDPGVKVDRAYEPFRDGDAAGHFAGSGDGKRFTMEVWAGKSAFPDFYRSEVRRWWGDWHRVYAQAGVAGIWNDMNEPAGWGKGWYIGDGVVPLRPANTANLVHRLDDGRTVPHRAVRNAYGHLENRAAYEGLMRLRPDERPFVLTRAAFAGTQRYAAQWTGDVPSTWAALRQSLPMLLGLGLSGAPFVGSDIGGFLGDCNPELYARWVQIGALAPFCRSHTSLYTHRQEPWSFGPCVEAVARSALRLRYRLLPYLYTCFFEASQTGMPVWRPMFAEFPDDARTAAVEDQVMVGPALLAAPVIEPAAAQRRITLPPGEWFDWHSGTPVAGGGEISAAAPLETMPLLARGDSAVPTQADVRHAGDRPDGPIRWRLFVAGMRDGHIGALYEDDGRSFAYRDGDWHLTPVVATRHADTVEVRFGPSCGRYVSPRRVAELETCAPGFEVAAVDGGAVAPGAAVRWAHDGGAHVVVLRRRRPPA